MADVTPSLTSRLANLNPFSASKRPRDDEDAGELIDATSVAGGGHSARQTAVTKNQLRVSDELKMFIVREGILSDADAANPDALQALLDRPHIHVPPHVTDRSFPLPEYFISSSHNTYLMAHQLFGTSSATAYETALKAGFRCVEIDAWDGDENPAEPKVTHGYTLVSNIPFRAVCETIRDVVDKEAAESVNEQGYRAAPIFLSLENHCNPEGQLRLVQIMEEVWGDRLLSKYIREKGHQEQHGGKHVTLDELGSKIVVIVEYHFAGEPETSDDDSSSDEEQNSKVARQAYQEKKKTEPTTVIIPELAAIGVYAQSVKPVDNSWYEGPALKDGPHHHLINVSESGLGGHLPHESDKIARHNAHHLMRVYPKGTRISSRNLAPVPFWGVGAQICALNSQSFDAGVQLNEALFSGTDGYVLKPAALRADGDGKLSSGLRKKLRLHIAGASSIPIPEGREVDDIKPYVTCSLLHPDHGNSEPQKRKTGGYKHHTLDLLAKGGNPPNNDPIWNEVLEWDYKDNDLTFLRILIKSDDRFASNPKLAVAAVRLMYVTKGWSFIRMLDLHGGETTCSLLLKFHIQDA